MTQTDSEILAQINTFAMSRLVEAALINVSRIEGIWKIIVAHFDILSNCQVLAVRQLTIEALQVIVLEIFAFKKLQQTKSKPSPRENLKALDDMSLEADSLAGTEEVSSDDELNVQNDEEQWSDFVWQFTILTPLAEQLKSNHS